MKRSLPEIIEKLREACEEREALWKLCENKQGQMSPYLRKLVWCLRKCGILQDMIKNLSIPAREPRPEKTALNDSEI